MAFASTTCSPNSLQLRLALNCRSYRNSHSVVVRMQSKKLHREVRVRCVSQNGEERVPDGKGAEYVADTFSGWSDWDNDDKSKESLKKNSLKGVVGAGVAGVILVTGLTFAAFSLSKRSVSRPTLQMEPLTAQQELQPASFDESLSDKVQAEQNEGDKAELVVRDVEYKEDIDQDSPSFDENPIKDQVSNSNESSPLDDIKHAAIFTQSVDYCNNEKYESTLVDMSTAPESTPMSMELPEADLSIGSTAPELIDSDDSPFSVLPEPTPDFQESLFSEEYTNLSDSENLNTIQHEQFAVLNSEESSDIPVISSSAPILYDATEHGSLNTSLTSQFDATSNSMIVPSIQSPSSEENTHLNQTPQVSADINISSMEAQSINVLEAVETSVSASVQPYANQQETNGHERSTSILQLPTHWGSFLASGIPAPSTTLELYPGKVLIPAAVDQVQGQALAALQVLKVIDEDAQPGDLCTRREYARWLVSASSVLSRNTMSKVYPAMYIENFTELAFDDITPDDPDFPSIQGLAEAGLISSKLSNHDLLNDDQGPFFFFPDSPLSRQELVSWKMVLEKRKLPEADAEALYQLSGFIDIDKINRDAWPSLLADLSAGEQGIIALTFGCTRLFQPSKPVTKSQAAVALATGEASDIVSEELARIEAESVAENVVCAHNALVAQVEKDINASFEKQLSLEREKIDALEQMARQARSELEKLRAEREEENLALSRERVAVESEMEVLSRLRREMEEHLQNVMSNKAEISYDKERISKLRKEAEDENQQISRLQYELEVERKALSMARAWAEDEAKRARDQAKSLEEVRERWGRRGLKVVVDSDLQEESAAADTWINAATQISVEETTNRAETLVDKLKLMADDVRGKSRDVINSIIQKMLVLILALKDLASRAGRKAGELKDRTGSRVEELRQATISKMEGPVEELRLGATQFSSAAKESVMRVAGDCREGVEKLTQKFKA